MTQEDKDLLLKDLCARLPYGVKVLDNFYKDLGVSKIINIGDYGSILVDNEMDDIQYYPIIDDIKPYLRPMSSMTEEESKEFAMLQTDFYSDGWLYPIAAVNMVNWLNAHHFDYRGLIEKDLAIAVTEENNPYKS